MLSSTCFNLSDDLSHSLDNQVHNIAATTFAEFQSLAPDLLSGNAGLSLLHGYLAKLFPERYSKTCKTLVDKLCNSIENETLPHSLSSGFSGIAFALQHIQNLRLPGLDCYLSFEDCDQHIERATSLEIKRNNWDPLHGYVGMGIYFLERHKTSDQTAILGRIVNALYSDRFKYNGSYIFVTPGYKDRSNDNINFGIAHGMPGIIAFLSLVAQENIEKDLCLEIVTSCLGFILDTMNTNQEKSLFPTYIELVDNKKVEESRLAWCYGDLCISNALLHAGKSFNNRDWVEKGTLIALSTTNRVWNNTGIIDPAFCHGVAGIIHQYSRIYKLTGDITFRNAVHYYINTNLKYFYKSQNKFGGYQYSTYDESYGTFKYSDVPGLLEGSAGIALVYLSIVYDIVPAWDIIFLTNV